MSADAQQNVADVQVGPVDFRLMMDGDDLAPLPRRVWVDADAPAVARVSLVAERDPSLGTADREQAPRVEWDWHGDTGHLSTTGVRACMRRIRAGFYAATLRHAPESWGLLESLRSISAAVATEEGGFVVHAAAVEVASGAVLFTGPSGAGKSTASALARAPVLAGDKAVVAKFGGEWLLWPISDSRDALGVPSQPTGCRPVRGLLRVVRGGSEPRIMTASRSDALVLARTAVLSPVLTTEREQHLLDSLAGLVDAVPVGRFETVLGVEHGAMIRDWLDREACR